MAALGDELRQARQEAGLSQEEVAHRAGVTRPYVSYIETGRFKPTVEVVFRYCQAVGASPGEIIARAYAAWLRTRDNAGS